jgi:hypothetical protein
VERLRDEPAAHEANKNTTTRRHCRGRGGRAPRALPSCCKAR